MIRKNTRMLLLLAIPTALLLLPLIAMQFTPEVHWTSSDFIIGGILLFSTALLIELGLRLVKRRKHRLLIIGLLVFVLAVIWAELAVGIFGTPWAGS
ncbi:MAG: hypothetical protein Q4F57_10270 [Weeksellaceae bacterium]|nr:hypothetical protein [Weeksellaceae bacterium]